MAEWIKRTKEDGTTVLINPNFVDIVDGKVEPPEPAGKSNGLTEGVTAPKPTATEYAKQEKRVKAHAAQRYLSETDWYVYRKAETGKEIPSDILDARAKARTDADFKG
jgi:hypothetical protein